MLWRRAAPENLSRRYSGAQWYPVCYTSLPGKEADRATRRVREALERSLAIKVATTEAKARTPSDANCSVDSDCRAEDFRISRQEDRNRVTNFRQQDVMTKRFL